ncbi:MAG: hypothetical protein WCA81_13345 [Rhizomicrobium sp.]
MTDSQSRGPKRAARPISARLPVLSLPITDVGAELLAIVALIPLFLHAALWNHFPFVFYDTGAYILEGLGRVLVPERSSVYSLFLRYAGARQSLWLVALAQSGIAAFTVTEFARAVRRHTKLWELLLIGLFLAYFSSIAWFVGQIEPDFLTAILPLAYYPLAFRAERVGWVRGVPLVCIAAFATGGHPSHLGLSAGLIICIAVYKIGRWLLRRRMELPSANLILPVLSFVLGLALVYAANYSLMHKLFVSRAGMTFLTARLMGDGIVKPTLDDICPTRHLKLCAYKDHLPATADNFLWGSESPFNRLGRFKDTDQEYQIIAEESLKHYPWRSFTTGLYQSVRQFGMFRTGDGVFPQEWVLSPEFRNFMPKQTPDYLKARQQRGTLRFIDVNVVHYTLAVLAVFWLCFELWRVLRRREWGKATLPAFIFLALLGNALVCGMFSGPHDRYQARLIWVVPFVLLLTARPRLHAALRRPVESGT